MVAGCRIGRTYARQEFDLHMFPAGCQNSSSPKAPRIFISYSHDSLQHRSNVWNLAKRLRSEGIDAIIDLYEPAPEEGFPRWIEKQIESADFVLIVCTATYLRRIRGQERPGRGHRVLWEGTLIYQQIYEKGTRNDKFIPVLFKKSRPANIPAPLRPFTYYRVDSSEGYEALYRRVSSQQGWLVPPLGSLKTFPSEGDPGAAEDVDCAQYRVSLALRELLAARTLQDLERVDGTVTVLTREYPNEPDAILLRRQVKQAIEREQIASREAKERLRVRLALMGGGLALLLIGVIVVGPRRAWQEGKEAADIIESKILDLSGFGLHVRPSAPLPPPPPPPELLERISITSLRDGMAVKAESRAVIDGRIWGSVGDNSVYVLSRPAGENSWDVHRVHVRDDGSWALYADLANGARYVWSPPLEQGRHERLEIMAVVTNLSIESALKVSPKDDLARLPSQLSPDLLARLPAVRSEIYHVRVGR